MLPLCRSEGVGVMAWSPLARGRLTRPWEARGAGARAEADRYSDVLFRRTEALDRPIVEAVNAVAGEAGARPGQVALAWLLGKPVVSSAIIGATRVEHLDEAAVALTLRLDEAQVARLEQPYQPHAVVGFS